MGNGGDQVVIAGYQFGDAQGTGQVTIGYVEVSTILSWSDNEIEMIVPPGAPSGPVIVSTPEWESNDSTIFHREGPPEITGVSPPSARPGDLVTIQGKDFGPGVGKVAIGGFAAKVLKGGWKYDAIVCKIPRKLTPGTYDVSVTTKFGAITLPAGFTLLASPIGRYNRTH